MKRIVIIFTALLLIGCQRVDVGQAPLDTGMIKTEAVRTAIAEITVQAILHPATPAVSITSSPSATKIVITQSTGTPTSQNIANQVEQTPIPFEPVYACVIDTDASLPLDGPQRAGEKVEKTWVIRNSGNVDWMAENVRVKWIGGVNLCEQDCIEWSGQVKPGGSYMLKIELSMPVLPTDKPQIVAWGLVNPENEIFCKLYYLIPNVY